MELVNGIIFDCFGVIYSNYVDNYLSKHKDKFSNYSQVIDSLNTKIDLGIISQKEYYKKLEGISGLKAEDIQKGMDLELVADTKLFELITKLKMKYKIGLLSNAGEEEISIIYKENINNLFDAITISYQEGISKPNKHMFKVCLDKLNLTFTDTLFIDDSMTNIDAAKKFGMQTIHYRNFKKIPDELIHLV